jgi:hypothetical protein
MDYIEIIKRAFRITFQHKSLWVLGFLASLAGGSGSGSSGGNVNLPSGGSGGSGGSSGFPDNMPLNEFSRMFNENVGIVIAVIIALCCFVLVLSLIFMALGEIGHGGLIANVSRIENSERPGLGDGWQAGVSRLRTLFGQQLLLAIPGVIIAIVILAALAIGFAPLFTELARGGDFDRAPEMMMGGIFGALCLLVPLACVGWIWGILSAILSTFGRRAVMLNGAGAIDGFKQGWAVFRANIGNSIVMAIILFVVNFVIGLGLVLAALALLAPAGIAFFAASGSGSSFEPATIAVLIVGGLAFIVLSVIVQSILTTLNSAVWTLSYRQFTQPPAAPAVLEAVATPQ